jgi:hypothetical protein
VGHSGCIALARAFRLLRTLSATSHPPPLKVLDIRSADYDEDTRHLALLELPCRDLLEHKEMALQGW